MSKMLFFLSKEQVKDARREISFLSSKKRKEKKVGFFNAFAAAATVSS